MGGVNSLPPAPLPPAPLRPERNFPWSRVVLVCVAAVVVAVVVAPLNWRFNLRREVKRELALCRAAGQPVTLEELAGQYPPVPDAENAALPLLEIWRADDPEYWEAWLAGRRPLPERRRPTYDPDLPVLGRRAESVPRQRGQPQTPAQRAAAEAWWKANEIRMARVAAALQRPQMRFPLDFADDPAMQPPHLYSLGGEAQQFRLRAMLAAEAGDAEAALSAIEACSATARLLETEPVFLSQLVLLAHRAVTRVAVEDYLNRLRPTTNHLPRLARAVEWSPAGDQHRLALIAERVSSRWLYSLTAREWARVTAHAVARLEAAEPSNETGMAAGMKLMRLTGLTDSDERLFLQTMRRAVAAAEPIHANRAESQAAFDAAEVKAGGLPLGLLSGMRLPAISKLWDRFARSEAETAMARMALALERHLLDHGALPGSLHELVPACLPAVTEDPFSGQPLRYRRLDHGYVLYSVGPDGVDDGGRPQDATDKQQKTWDIPFTVEREDLARPGAPPFVRGGVQATPVIAEAAEAGLENE